MAGESSVDNRADQVMEQPKDDRLAKIEQEISELKDGNDQTNEDIENLNWLLTREFAETLWQENAQNLLKQIGNKYSEWENFPDWLQKLIDFLEPIANPFSAELKMDGLNDVKWVEEGQKPADTFVNSINKSKEEWKESPKDETLNQIKKMLSEDFEDILDTEEAKDIKEALNKIQIVLENPTSDNVKALQKTIYENLKTESDKKSFMRRNKNKTSSYSEDDMFDWLFGKSTLEWTNKYLNIMADHLKELQYAKTVMDEHEQINKDAEAEQKRIQAIEAKRNEEATVVNNIVDAINANIVKEKEYIDSLDIESVFSDYPLKGSRKIDREINALKHIDDVQKQVESLKAEREDLNKQLNTSKELLNSAQTRSWKRFAEKQIRTYERQIHEINLKYNELKNQEDLKTPIEEKIRIQLNTIREEYEDQFIKLDWKVKRLKWVDLSDFWDGLSEDAKKAILAEQESRTSNHKTEIEKYNANMTKILSFLWSKYEWGKLVDDTSKTSDFEKFANKYNVDNDEKDPVDVNKLNTVIEWLKNKSISEFWKLDANWKFQFNEWMLINEWSIKYVKVWEEKFQLCDKNTKNITSSLVCLVSGGGLYFASYKDWKVSSDWALLHSKELQQWDGSEPAEWDGSEPKDTSNTETIISKDNLFNGLTWFFSNTHEFWERNDFGKFQFDEWIEKTKWGKKCIEIWWQDFYEANENYTWLWYKTIDRHGKSIYFWQFENGVPNWEWWYKSYSWPSYIWQFSNWKEIKGKYYWDNVSYEWDFKDGLWWWTWKFTWENWDVFEGSFDGEKFYEKNNMEWNQAKDKGYVRGNSRLANPFKIVDSMTDWTYTTKEWKSYKVVNGKYKTEDWEEHELHP